MVSKQCKDGYFNVHSQRKWEYLSMLFEYVFILLNEHSLLIVSMFTISRSFILAWNPT